MCVCVCGRGGGEVERVRGEEVVRDMMVSRSQKVHNTSKCDILLRGALNPTITGRAQNA